MRIAGHKNSFVDFPGKIAIVVFTPGCNMNCFYCHNKTLISGGNEEFIDNDEVLELLVKRGYKRRRAHTSEGSGRFFGKGQIPGICGKAGYQRDKSHVVENLVQNGLVDYIAMDVKAPFGKYNEICRTNVDVDSIKKSIEIIKSGKVDYEFRTTVAPGLEMDDIFEIGRNIGMCRKAL